MKHYECMNCDAYFQYVAGDNCDAEPTCPECGSTDLMGLIPINIPQVIKKPE